MGARSKEILTIKLCCWDYLFSLFWIYRKVHANLDITYNYTSHWAFLSLDNSPLFDSSSRDHAESWHHQITFWFDPWLFKWIWAARKHVAGSGKKSWCFLKFLCLNIYSKWMVTAGGWSWSHSSYLFSQDERQNLLWLIRDWSNSEHLFV